MTGLRMTNRSIFGRRGRKSRGFTLVELIVILIIVAILAAAGVATALGYIKKTKFDKNNQSAITVYQTAQTALSNKMANGTIQRWILDLPGFDASDVDFTSDSETNFSQHKTVSLTYNHKTPGGVQDKYLYEFLSPYLYYPTIFGGTLSVEFDICITKDNGHLNYTANVLSAFFSSENDSETGGWDQNCIGGSTDGLPNRSESYRRSTSLVGYYDGLDSDDNVVSAVTLPWDSDLELEGHVVGPTEGNKQVTGYLFNLRNAETLDVSWAIFDADRDAEREDDSEYTYEYKNYLSPYHKENLYIYLHDYDDPDKKVELIVTEAALEKVNFGSVTTIYEVIDGNKISRETSTGFITVRVLRSNEVDNYTDGTPVGSNGRDFTFPITRCLVKGDPRTGCPADSETGYYEYRISLDAIKTRSTADYNESNNYKEYFGSIRLFGNATPQNIYAVLGSASNWTYMNNNGQPQGKTVTYNTYAARAIDDPVYFEGAGIRDGELKYCYQVKEHCGKFDGADDTEMYEDYVITGECVVNTFFGDKVYDTPKNSTGDTMYIGGTIWGSTDKSAVLTNCRHLYNIGLMTSNDIVTYRVVSNINWYFHETSGGEDYYASEVRVFNKTKYASPVNSDGDLCVVSFPAIKKLQSNSTLTSISDLNRRVYSINNIQLRKESFVNKTDNGYALICLNEGRIYNLYADNINMIFTSVVDGSDSDYQLISSGETVSVSENSQNGYDVFPIGSLVGHNKGIIGSPDETFENKNTVRVSNSIVMAGGYWQYHGRYNDVGGVIGKNTGRESGVISTYGVIEVSGSFAVVGSKSTGGIIGYNEASIGARLVVDGSNVGKSEFDFPALNAGGESHDITCAVISRYRAGGAIGYFEANDKRVFDYDAASYSISDADTETGEFSFGELDNEDFNIYVNLPSSGLILNLDGNSNDSSVGGAIACVNNPAGDYLSIRVNNSGKIISAYSGTGFCYCGGAIGKEMGNENSYSIKTIFIDCKNNAGSRIGSISNSYGASVAGGAIGRLDGSTTNGRKIAINVVNNGVIMSRGNGNDASGSGGAVGGSKSSKIPFTIKVVNGSDSSIIGYGNSQGNAVGTGGAFGGFGENGNDNCKLPADTLVYVENYGTISGVHHVGGAIGNSPSNSGRVYAINHNNTIEGFDYVGGVVGRNAKNQYGSVFSLLDGTTVSGRSFVGGAFGRCLNLRSSGSVITSVKGSSSVEGSEYLVGGVGGDIGIADNDSTVTIKLIGFSSNPELTVKSGLDGAGGAIGLLRSQQNILSADLSMPSQSDLDRLVILVDGRNDVGGAIGRLMSSTNDKYDSNTPSEFLTKASNKEIALKVDQALNPKSHVIGTGENVGGAIGHIKTSGGKFTGHINVTSIYGSSDTNSVVITGVKNVGGAVGKMDKPVPNNSNSESGIYVDFTKYPASITGTVSNEADEANVGGAIGYIYGDSNTEKPSFPVTSSLGTSTVSSGGSNVGGAIGYNNGSLAKADITSTLNKGGTIQGGGKVGGAIGRNFCDQVRGKINSISATINGEVKGTGTGVGTPTGSGNWSIRRINIGTGDCVGGAVGYNHSSVEEVFVTISGSVSGSADSVGGAIGYCHSNNKNYWVMHIKTTIQGDAEISGLYNVGGSVGHNICNIYEINTNITGTSHIVGDMRVGGSVGFASADPGIAGDNVRNGAYWGRIDSIKTTISADYALKGNSRIGGSVGQQGDKWGDGNNYISAALLKVEAELNTAYLCEAFETGPDDPNENACVGGVFGIFVDGRVGGEYHVFAYDSSGAWTDTKKISSGKGVILSGTGGLVKLDYPNQSYTHAVLISAKGRSIGGLVGQIGVEAYSKSETWFNQNVCMSNINVSDNGPDICVVSVNGADRVGGWIGSGFAAHGGIGADLTNDPMVTYNVDTVKVVYSKGSYVGGFCGYSTSFNNGNNGRRYTRAYINVTLDNANINGSTCVGGVFGGVSCCNFTEGSINVSLLNRTNIGDIIGNAMPGDNTTYEAICYDAGGAIGCVSRSDHLGNTIESTIMIPINVTIDDTSRVCGYGEADDQILAASDAGVGGAFGRCAATFKNSGSVRVDSVDSGNIAVYSSESNVGGISGVMNVDCTLNKCYALVSVSSAADGACAGGVIGKILGGTINNSHFGPDSSYVSDTSYKFKDCNYFVKATGDDAFAGGFVGSVEVKINIENCYTTAKVIAEKGTAGGFAGLLNLASIKKCYVGGHTYSGQYLSNNCDVTGLSNVGGFVGKTVGAATFENCYTTASVLGTGNYVGGFAGYRDDAAKVADSYCTGLVKGNDINSTGAFAGYSAATNYNKVYVMSGINNGMKLAGNIESTDPIPNLSYKNAEDIKGTGSYIAYPFDSTLGNLGDTFALRAVISNEHWGDWPIPAEDKKNITENVVITLNKNEYDYDKDGVKIDSELILTDGDYTLVFGEDYKIDYINNDRVGDATANISGIGEYSGAFSIPFKINKASIKDAVVTIDGSEGEELAAYEYTGAPVVPDITVKLGDDVLEINKDFYLEYDPNNTNICDRITVTVIGNGNYKDKADMKPQFSIVGRNIEDAEVTLTNATAEELVYTGSQITPGVVVRIDGRTLANGSDYKVSYGENIHAGTDAGIIIIEPLTAEYSGEKTVNFTITQATNTVTQEPAISDWTWKEEPSVLSSKLEARFGEPVYSVYTESTCTDPDKCKISRVSEEELHDQMADLDAGSYYLLAEVPETEDYTAVSKIVPFKVNPADITGNAEVTLSYEVVAYNGESQTPDVTQVLYKSIELSSDDYEVNYGSDTTNPGTKTITITGKHNCTGSVTTEYKINPVYTITFNATGGELNQSAGVVYVESGKSISDLTDFAYEDPTYEGHRFICWYNNESYYGDSYTFDSPVTSAFTLYAKWINTYTVTYVLYEENGENVVKTQVYDLNERLQRPEDPTRPGYVFEGWYYNKQGEGTTDYLWSFEIPVQSNYTIYAHWTPRTDIKVTFDSRGGTSVDEQTLTYPNPAVRPADPTLDGKEFGGWFTDEECTVPFDFEASVPNDVTVYAKWN